MAIPDRLENKAAIEAAKAEILAAIAQTDGKLDVGISAVKSVQKGIIQRVSTYSKEDSSFENAHYIDINISDVDIDKSIILVNTASASSGSGTNIINYFPCARFISGNVIRVYETFEYNDGGSYIEKFIWKVIEFY